MSDTCVARPEYREDWKGYVKDDCRCPPCCNAHYLHDKRYRVKGPDPRVSADEVREHIRMLDDAGTTQLVVATLARCGTATVWRLRVGEMKSLRADLADRILAVRPGQYLPGTLIPGDLTYRRLESLMFAGWPWLPMRLEMGFLSEKRPMIRASNAELFRAYYREHKYGQGPSRQTARYARRRGWIAPMAWNDPGTLQWPKDWPERHTPKDPWESGRPVG